MANSSIMHTLKLVRKIQLFIWNIWSTKLLHTYPRTAHILEIQITSICKVRMILVCRYTTSIMVWCTQKDLSSAIRVSSFKVNGKAVHMYVHTHPSEWQDNLFSSSTAVSFARVFTHIYLCPMLLLTSMTADETAQVQKMQENVCEKLKGSNTATQQQSFKDLLHSLCISSAKKEQEHN